MNPCPCGWLGDGTRPLRVLRRARARLPGEDERATARPHRRARRAAAGGGGRPAGRRAARRARSCALASRQARAVQRGAMRPARGGALRRTLRSRRGISSGSRCCARRARGCSRRPSSDSRSRRARTARCCASRGPSRTSKASTAVRPAHVAEAIGLRVLDRRVEPSPRRTVRRRGPRGRRSMTVGASADTRASRGDSAIPHGVGSNRGLARGTPLALGQSRRRRKTRDKEMNS